MNKSMPIKRLFAQLIDSFFIFGLVVFLTVVTQNIFMAFFLSNIIFVVIQFAMWSKSTTIGKNALGMRVVELETGESIGFSKMFLRETIGKYISGLLFSFGYILILIDKDNQGLHDKLVGTTVVDV